MQLHGELQAELWVGAQARGPEVLTLCREMGLRACGPVREGDTKGHGRS